MIDDGSPSQGLTSETPTPPRPLVMVADDHDDTRDLMRFLLERWGYRVVEAADGAEAVEVAGRVRPSLVLLDIGLPGLDGLGAARRLRECDGLGAVPVVAVSGHAAARDRDEAFAAGCVGYLTKPFTSAQLSALVTQFLP